MPFARLKQNQFVHDAIMDNDYTADRALHSLSMKKQRRTGINKIDGWAVKFRLLDLCRIQQLLSHLSIRNGAGRHHRYDEHKEQ